MQVAVGTACGYSAKPLPEAASIGHGVGRFALASSRNPAALLRMHPCLRVAELSLLAAPPLFKASPVAPDPVMARRIGEAFGGLVGPTP